MSTSEPIVKCKSCRGEGIVEGPAACEPCRGEGILPAPGFRQSAQPPDVRAELPPHELAPWSAWYQPAEAS
jgi:hypothetical protein